MREEMIQVGDSVRDWANDTISRVVRIQDGDVFLANGSVMDATKIGLDDVLLASEV